MTNQEELQNWAYGFLSEFEKTDMLIGEGAAILVSAVETCLADRGKADPIHLPNFQTLLREMRQDD